MSTRRGAVEGRTLRGIAGLLALLAAIGIPAFVVVTHAPMDTHMYVLVGVLAVLGYLLLGGNAKHLAEVARSATRFKK